MYLISVYFDSKTENTMQSYINYVARATGNTFMLDGKIPPHITLLAFEAKDEQKAVELLEKNIHKFTSDSLLFASIGAFKRQVLYIEPVLNEYLHNMSLELYDIYKDMPDIRFSPYYKPFGWLPHLSIVKHLKESQIEEAFKVLVRQFATVEGTVTRIGIAKTNPHKDIRVYTLS